MSVYIRKIGLVMLFWFLGIQTTFSYQVLPDSSKTIIRMNGLFQARCSFRTNRNIDLNGLHHIDGKAVYNSFGIKRARIQLRSKISDRTEVMLLFNLVDFKNKILENAAITYRFNPYINFRMGQFRPAFGLEDTYPIDIIKSIDFSDQYHAFAQHGWQGFQIGASIYGGVQGCIPIKYEFTVVNGNGRNQAVDDDNDKHISSRFEFGLQKKLNIKLGLNGGLAHINGVAVYASGIDLTGSIPFGKKWSLGIETEAKQGTNYQLFKLDVNKRDTHVENYQMRGFYMLPNLRYAIHHDDLTSLEFSCRYEYFDGDFQHATNNPRQSYTPMLSADFFKNYRLRIQLGAHINYYQNNIPATTGYNNHIFILQIQSRL